MKKTSGVQHTCMITWRFLKPSFLLISSATAQGSFSHHRPHPYKLSMKVPGFPCSGPPVSPPLADAAQTAVSTTMPAQASSATNPSHTHAHRKFCYHMLLQSCRCMPLALSSSQPYMPAPTCTLSSGCASGAWAPRACNESPGMCHVHVSHITLSASVTAGSPCTSPLLSSLCYGQTEKSAQLVRHLGSP